MNYRPDKSRTSDGRKSGSYRVNDLPVTSAEHLVPIDAPVRCVYDTSRMLAATGDSLALASAASLRPLSRSPSRQARRDLRCVHRLGGALCRAHRGHAMLMTGAPDEQPRRVSYRELLGLVRRAANLFVSLGGPHPGA
jgi:hypothetical protein